MNSLAISAAAITNIGKIRQTNEDNIFFDGTYLLPNCDKSSWKKIVADHKGGFVCAVFDGMGGEACGEKAAEFSAAEFDHQFGAFLPLTKADAIPLLSKFYCSANQKVSALSATINAVSGSTAVALVINKSGVMVSNIGDSKAFRIHDQKIIQLSEDHTLAALMIKSGVMTKEEAQQSKGKNALTRFIGISSDSCDLLPYYSDWQDLVKDDFYLLCSDGLTDMVTADKILAAFSSQKTCSAIADELMNESLNNGGKDNCTIIVVKISNI